jgi:hypothetical protein
MLLRLVIGNGAGGFFRLFLAVIPAKGGDEAAVRWSDACRPNGWAVAMLLR